MSSPVPFILGEALELFLTQQFTTELTEIANQVGLCSIRCPFPIDDLVVGTDIETKSEISLGEFIVSTFMLRDSFLPFSKAVVPLNYGRDIWLKVAVDF